MSSFDAGGCFQLKDASGKHHLHIILCGASGDPPSIISALVNTAIDQNTAHNFHLGPGDHRFIKRTSIVNYGSLRVIYVDLLMQAERISLYK